MPKHAAVVGSGLVGSLWTTFLAQRGYHVDVFERRADSRRAGYKGGRSINLALSDRGWRALEAVGVAEAVRREAIPMFRRVMHAIDGTITTQPYGEHGQAIWSVSRGGINMALMTEAEKHANVRLHFEHETDLDDATEGRIKWTTPEGQGSGCFDAVFSTDGANSGIRKALQAEGAMEWTEQVIDHGYKELLIPSGPDGTSLIEREALHIWPRASYMLIGLPNPDGSFTMTLFFPNEGLVSFAALDTPEAAEVFFAEFFADALALMPDFKEQWAQNPVSKLGIVRSWPWSKGKVVLFGDASHAIVPFYGQGMNSGFEDCFELNRMMDALGEDPATLFPAFEAERKPNADAIAELALLNFIEMRDLTGQPEFLLRKKIESKLHAERPDQWIPLYTQVTFSHIPYSVALERGRQMDRVFAEVMQWPGIAENWDQPETLAKIWKVADRQLVTSN